MRLTAAIGLLLFTLNGGCRSHATTGEPEHNFSAHMPADYPAAVERVQRVHREILTGALVAREVPATQVHHDHPHDHEHRHVHGQAHPHVHLDAVQKMGDLVRWLPILAADSDLEEEPWNRVYATANSLGVILTEASSRNGDERRETYLSYGIEVDRHLRQLIDIKRQFPRSKKSLAAGQ
jgi:hypothetical protein